MHDRQDVGSAFKKLKTNACKFPLISVNLADTFLLTGQHYNISRMYKPFFLTLFFICKSGTKNNLSIRSICNYFDLRNESFYAGFTLLMCNDTVVLSIYTRLRERVQKLCIYYS